MPQTQILGGVGINLLDAVANGVLNGSTFTLPPGPNMLTWTVAFGAAPGSITIALQTSNDGTNWGTIDTSVATVSGAVKTTYTAAPFIRAAITAVAGGTTTTVNLFAKPMKQPRVFGSGVTVLATQSSTVGNGADVTEDVLFSALIPANTLISSGKIAKLRCWGQTANNGNSKTLKLKFGADTYTAFSGVVTAQSWYAEYTLMHKTAISTQNRVGRSEFGSTQATTVVGVIALPETSDIIVQITGQTNVATANDVTVEGAILDVEG